MASNSNSRSDTASHSEQSSVHEDDNSPAPSGSAPSPSDALEDGNSSSDLPKDASSRDVCPTPTSPNGSGVGDRFIKTMDDRSTEHILSDARSPETSSTITSLAFPKDSGRKFMHVEDIDRNYNHRPSGISDTAPDLRRLGSSKGEASSTLSARSARYKTPTSRSISSSGSPIQPMSSFAPEPYRMSSVICHECGRTVSYRDEETGEFTMRNWDTHRVTCTSFIPPPMDPRQAPPPFLLQPPVMKRRRAKRTEGERIAYLRSDPYVAEFEAYRVLCGSCSKWIRLRPNSTYCSIPWDAHRKSCLAKRVYVAVDFIPSSMTEPSSIRSGKNAGKDEREAVFTSDPDVRRYDAERVSCGKCDQWINVVDVRDWLRHKACCPSKMPHSPVARQISPPMTSLPLPSPTSPQSPAPSTPQTDGQQDSRQRNATLRRHQLTSDSLIRIVEPNRVFCAICEKWVQLRQDSSYCAYPWVQHRTKCIKRSAKKVKRDGDSSRRSQPSTSSTNGTPLSTQEPMTAVSYERHSSTEESFSEDDEDGDARPVKRRRPNDGRQGLISPPSPPHPRPCSHTRAPFDLSTIQSRTGFIAISVRHLFSTTYSTSDCLTVSALLAYLNSAYPEGKWPEFDFAEVVRGVGRVREVRLLGDNVTWRT